MPEGPEVETVRRTLEPHLTGRGIRSVRVLLPRIIRRPDPEDFRAGLAGGRVHGVLRRGKYLVLDLGERGRLVVHLMMSGQLVWAARPEAAAEHTRVVLGLDDGSELRMVDARTLGGLWLLGPEEAGPRGLERLGADPIAEGVDAALWRRRFAGRRAPIKALLLDQAVVAGVGNIYADEALFAARIHPATEAGRLGADPIERLARAVEDVMREAVAHRGTTLRSYADGEGQPGGHGPHLMVYGRTGQSCRLCGESIVKIKVAGRGTHLCSRCQPSPWQELPGAGAESRAPGAKRP